MFLKGSMLVDFFGNGILKKIKKVLTSVESDAIIDKLSRATGKQISRSEKINKKSS